MKYIVVLGDGMSDLKLAALGDKTPLQVAKKPNIDKLAKAGEMGLVQTVPEGYPPGSDVANLSVMGYNPETFYTGRSPIEAVSMGVELGPEDIAFRCNLVTLSEEKNYQDKTMLDYSAGEIGTGEARTLISDLHGFLGNEILEFHGGISYRHLMVWRKGEEQFELIPPHDISDRKITDYLPKGAKAEFIQSLMEKSYAFLTEHPINIARVAQGLNPANSIWLWGQGKKPALANFHDKYGLTGSVISAVDLVKGLGLCAGLDVVEVEGATGNIHTNFKGKALAAIEELKKGKDFIYLHVEAPDEAGHQGDLDTKIKAIEEIDEKVVAVLLDGLKDFVEYRILILPDHPTPISLKTHTSDPVPYLLYDSRVEQKQEVNGYDETSAAGFGLKFTDGYKLLDFFLTKN